ncbi:Rho GTPase-activating protein 21 [Habropoda laboriosa]|uniref:Rho GTPase-activating protein 21 n=1 Tax=Habropoda laboriosa TaxID=597456 RepID=A0A0L7QVE1_9HYME|nr:Rho GTPase-activating protein 21 [Habropoda laboriosa]
MAEDRNNCQGLVGQAHTVEHGSPAPTLSGIGSVAGTITATRNVHRDDSPPRGPRTLLLRRGENGFGFTLRHFIVYPPESCCMLPGHERTRIDEPMDTIFVKQVRGNSPAAEAGLRTGDRVVSVDGKPTRGEQYAKVVQRIQQAGPWLRLLVVSKEDDILQRYFGETAHNPETNQRPRLRSPERSGGPRQRRSVSMIPGLSPRTRQSWVCSGASSMPDRTIDDAVCTRDPDICSKLSDRHQQQLQRNVGKSNNFIGTLSRIHENVASVGVRLSGERQSMEARNGASSLPSSPGPDKKVSDKFPTLPPGLQIVSKRAKQFESGRLLSDDDEPTGDRTNLYKSELSRLSNKRSVPNVAVRKREFESKAEAQEPRRIVAMSTRETKSLDIGSGLKGNRVIPVGSRRIHCEPPTDYKILEETPNSSRIIEGETIRPRIRSNSAESWESTSASNLSMIDGGRHQWPQRQDEDSERKRDNTNEEDGGGDDGYVDATNAVATGGKEKMHEKGCCRRQQQQDGYAQIIETDHGVHPSDNDVHGNGVVFRRQKNTQTAEEDRATRRVSYLKATWGERIHVDSDLELSDSEPIIHPSRGNNTCTSREAPLGGIVKDIEQVEREGPLHVKFTVLDGKVNTHKLSRAICVLLLMDRSWKQVWGVLRGPILFFYKDRQNQCPSLANDGENVSQSVDVRCSLVDIAEDYTKRKHVLRLANPNAEVLLQTEDAASMALWLRSLHQHAAAEKPSEIAHNSTLKQQAVPQTPGPTSSSSTYQTIVGGNTSTMAISSAGGGSGSQRLSPLPGHKGIKKLTSFRNRSPTGQSPINKTRKPSQTIESLVSPKTKTWKGRVAKQLRRMHGQTGSPSSPTTQLPPEGATFKVPLELCPPSSFSEYVPLIVEMCTSIVEARGLEVVGIYRVPGNTAAISHLTDSVNKGFENINLQDPRWSDVNVISSLLKSFFRQLPDSLLTAELYPMFIDADKVEDPQRRMTTIRKLLRDLPEHHFETLKYLMFHLKRIVEHCEVNKMEAKNLAIVFGPTLVRASGSRDNMVTMVTDMSHQCRIVESLLNNVDWFFSDDDLDDLSRLSVNLSLPAADTSEIETTTSANNHNLLLNNIQKVEGSGGGGVREMASAKDIVSSIISAANRKIQRRRKGQDETDNNESHEIDKSRTKQEGDESLLSNRRSMALNERQCSVSEIVLMHENKSNLNSRDDVLLFDKSNKYLSPTVESIQPTTTSHRSAVSSASESSSRLSSETGLSCFDASSTLSSASNDTKQSNDEIAIRTYAGLSATTQERIRRFEQETKAMLQRDQNRQRREAERREEERRRIEMEWQLAKREMENDDLLDSIVDTAVTTAMPTTYLSSTARFSTFNEQSFLDVGSRSTTRIPPLSIAVQQQPTSVRRVSQVADESNCDVMILPPENVSSTILKKLKTDTEQVLESSISSTLPPPVRYGSLDSLHETLSVSLSPLSPTSQQRKPLSSDVSDDGRGVGVVVGGNGKGRDKKKEEEDGRKKGVRRSKNGEGAGFGVKQISAARGRKRRELDQSEGKIIRGDREEGCVEFVDTHAGSRHYCKKLLVNERVFEHRELPTNYDETNALNTLRQTTNPGFWWYISSHLHGIGSPTGPASKTQPGPSPMPMSMPIPMSMPMPMPGRMQVPSVAAVSVSSLSTLSDTAADIDVARRPSTLVVASSSGVPASDPSEFSVLNEPIEPVVHHSPPRGVTSSGSGAGFSSKTLNRFLRGSDLLTSLTTTFDRKWRSLVNSSNQNMARGSGPENNNVGEEKNDERKANNKMSAVQSTGSCSVVEIYRDPSLHKTSIEKHHPYVRQKNASIPRYHLSDEWVLLFAQDAPEKDTDSSVTENNGMVNRRLDDDVPDNDRSAIVRRRIESKQEQLRSSKETIQEPSSDTNESQGCCRIEKEVTSSVLSDDMKDIRRDLDDSNYSNKLEKFESLTNNLEVRSRLKRSESLNKRSENTSSKLKRSESLNKHSAERLSSPTNGKLKRSESLNKHSERSDSPNSKLKRSESLTKTEKTECNISKRRQSVRKDSATKLKRKNGMPERSIKRRHTVGGTKDFDKVHWLDNKLQVETERVVRNEYRPKKSQLRTSSPDLSTSRIGLTDAASFLIEVSFRGPSNVVFNVTNTRPQSLPDTSLASKVFKVPLESHV